MELRFRVTMERAFDQVREVVGREPESWLPGSKRADGVLVMDLGVGGPAARVHRLVQVAVGPIQLFGWGIVVPIEWRAARHPRLYPNLLGYLRVEPLERGSTRLRFDARYDPPGGTVGTAADRALMNRVARASVGDFFQRLTACLDQASAGPGS